MSLSAAFRPFMGETPDFERGRGIHRWTPVVPLPCSARAMVFPPSEQVLSLHNQIHVITSRLQGLQAFFWMQCLFEGHPAIGHCTCMGAVVLWSAPRPFVAVFSVKRDQQCPCIQAKCMQKRYISSWQCDIEAFNMIQSVFHHGPITIHRPWIVCFVHSTPYAS